MCELHAFKEAAVHTNKNALAPGQSWIRFATQISLHGYRHPPRAGCGQALEAACGAAVLLATTGAVPVLARLVRGMRCNTSQRMRNAMDDCDSGHMVGLISLGRNPDSGDSC